MGVVLISTIFFKLAGISNWKLLALIWAIVRPDAHRSHHRRR